MAVKFNSASAKFLRRFRIAVLGFGSQGMAQALNLRDSGIKPVIGLPRKSKSVSVARKAGFDVFPPARAIEDADIIVVLIPDHKHADLFDGISPEKINSKAFIFAHGLSVAFGLVKIPRSCDLILVAPHGPGVRLRELYLAGQPFTAFWAVENDASRKAQSIARAYATAIGCPSAGLFKSSFRGEAIGDIFGEQAVLCGGLVGLLETGFDTLVRHGFTPKDAYLECVYQIDLIINLIKNYGPSGIFEKISKTAAFGSLQSKNLIFDGDMTRKMDRLYGRIESGRFARTLMKENLRGMRDLSDSIKKCRQTLLQKTHNQVSKKLVKK